MMANLYPVIMTVTGWLLTRYLFARFPRLPLARMGPAGSDHTHDERQAEPTLDVAVIIPARNEAAKLPGLLSDLRRQSVRPREILVVDDDSEDDTAVVAEAAGVRVLRRKGRPRGWTGKNAACQDGADHTEAPWLLFLDADVRLGPDALARIAEAWRHQGHCVSVQPYHETAARYESLSLPFNFLQLGGNGTTRTTDTPVGLHGPVIAIRRTDYVAVGGHAAVLGSIIDDLALGASLREAGIPFRLFVGEQDVRYRMYPEGVVSLYQGWVKNMAGGAGKTPPLTLLACILWVTAMFTTFWTGCQHVAAGCWPEALIFAAGYAVWAIILRRLGRKIGHFRREAMLLYPLPFLFMTAVVLISAVKYILRWPVRWKGRKVVRETCDEGRGKHANR